MHGRAILVQESEMVRSAPIRRRLETMETAGAVTVPLIQTVLGANTWLISGASLWPGELVST